MKYQDLLSFKSGCAFGRTILKVCVLYSIASILLKKMMSERKFHVIFLPPEMIYDTSLRSVVTRLIDMSINLGVVLHVPLNFIEISLKFIIIKAQMKKYFIFNALHS